MYNNCDKQHNMSSVVVLLRLGIMHGVAMYYTSHSDLPSMYIIIISLFKVSNDGGVNSV